MKFSIILPTYNVSAYVKKAILSVLEQQGTYGDFELLIIDDESTDGTWELVKSFSYDNRVKMYRLSHRGLGAARNFGISKAKGNYILYLDGDDEFDSRLLSILQSRISTESPDMLIFSWQRIDINGAVDSSLYGGPAISDMWTACWNKCYKRSILSNLVFPEGINYEDVGYAIHARLNAISLVHEPSAIYYHRTRPDGISRRRQTLSNRLDVLIGLEGILTRTNELEIQQVALKIILQHLNRSVYRREMINNNDLTRLQMFCEKHGLFSVKPDEPSLGMVNRACLTAGLKIKSVRALHAGLRLKHYIKRGIRR
ncbi:glycosyltransferase family 2 protein [Weissella cibaria]|nr:glycosyltransferase family 2 protein [Weissella cibaria]